MDPLTPHQAYLKLKSAQTYLLAMRVHFDEYRDDFEAYDEVCEAITKLIEESWAEIDFEDPVIDAAMPKWEQVAKWQAEWARVQKEVDSRAIPF